MNATKTAQQIKTLLKIKTDNYRASGESKPEISAQFAVDGIINMVKGQLQYLEQLLNEEIEDAIKAGKQHQAT